MTSRDTMVSVQFIADMFPAFSGSNFYHHLGIEVYDMPDNQLQLLLGDLVFIHLKKKTNEGRLSLNSVHEVCRLIFKDKIKIALHHFCFDADFVAQVILLLTEFHRISGSQFKNIGRKVLDNLRPFNSGKWG